MLWSENSKNGKYWTIKRTQKKLLEMILKMISLLHISICIWNKGTQSNWGNSLPWPINLFRFCLPTKLLITSLFPWDLNQKSYFLFHGVSCDLCNIWRCQIINREDKQMFQDFFLLKVLHLRWLRYECMCKQECIPVGCIPSAAVAIWGGGCLSRWSVCPGGVSAQGGCLPRGVSARGCVSAQGDKPPHCEQNDRQL